MAGLPGRHELARAGRRTAEEHYVISPFQSLAGLRRIAVTALAILPLLIVTLVTSPALLILPFSSRGNDRALKLIGKMVIWTRVVVSASR